MSRQLDLEALAARELRRAVAVDGRSMESVGRAAGFSRGYLAQLLRGRQNLKVKHIDRVLQVLEQSSAEFFARLGEELRLGGGASRSGLGGEGEEARPTGGTKVAVDGTQTRVVLEQPTLEEILRRLIREELDRRSTEDPLPEPR